LTVWVWLYGTLKTDVPQNEIILCTSAYPNADEIKLAKILPLPFEKQKAGWQLSTIELKAVCVSGLTLKTTCLMII